MIQQMIQNRKLRLLRKKKTNISNNNISTKALLEFDGGMHWLLFFLLLFAWSDLILL